MNSRSNSFKVEGKSLKKFLLFTFLSIILWKAFGKRKDWPSSDEELIDNYEDDFEELITVKSYEIGINQYDRKSLEQVLQENRLLDIKALGIMVLKDDIDTELARKTIKSIKVLGVLRASRELKMTLRG